MRHVTFYHVETGILNGVSVLVSDNSAVELNERLYPGHRAIDHPPGGTLNHRTQRVDVDSIEIATLETGELVRRFKFVPRPDWKEADQVAAPTACPCPKHKS